MQRAFSRGEFPQPSTRKEVPAFPPSPEAYLHARSLQPGATDFMVGAIRRAVAGRPDVARSVSDCAQSLD